MLKTPITRKFPHKDMRLVQSHVPRSLLKLVKKEMRRQHVTYRDLFLWSFENFLRISRKKK